MGAGALAKLDLFTEMWMIGFCYGRSNLGALVSKSVEI